MQGELSTPHQRVIIGSLWSTWRLRAQRKQLSLHPTLDCLSQQMPFPSPLPVFSSKFPPHHNLLWCTEWRNRKWWYNLWSHMTLFCHFLWMRQASVFADFFLSFKKWKERLKLLNCKVKVPLVTGAIWVSRTRQEKLTMLCSPSYFRTYFWGVSHTFLQKQAGNFLLSTFIFRNNVTAVISGYLINPNWTGEWCNAPCPLKGLVTPESSTVKILYVVLSTFKANFVN